MECEFTGLDQMWCAHCKPKPKPRPEDRSVVATITARFDGHCPECDGDILEGEIIHKLEPDDVWVHAHHLSIPLENRYGRRLR